MDTVNFIAPLEAIPNPNDTEANYQAIFRALFNGPTGTLLTVNGAILLINGEPLSLTGAEPGEFSPALMDLLNYGCPHIGSPAVVERFAKQEGLVALRQSDTSNVLMRILLANWLAHGSKRGLNFLQFALQVLFPDQWVINRLCHSIQYSQYYPAFLTLADDVNTFPTSRIRITLAESVESAIASELAPSLLRLVPANIVPSIAREPVPAALGVDIAVTGVVLHVADYSEFA